jgi:hypothetical protein
MEKLYALTRGDRRVTEFGELSQFNVDSKHGDRALIEMVKAIIGKKVSFVKPPVDYPDFFNSNNICSFFKYLFNLI